MLKTLRLSFSLKNTYRVNSILYAIRQIPLLNKLIPSSIYRIRAFKILANIISVIMEFFSIFIWKLLYFLCMISAVFFILEMPSDNSAPVFMHILLLLSIIGAFANTYMFNPSKDKYYAMILLGMDAKEYTLINYFYAIIKVLLGFTLSAFIFGLSYGLSVAECLIIPFFVAGVKLSVSAYTLKDYEKNKTVHNENKLKPLWWCFLGVLLVAAYGLPFIGIVIPETVSLICMGIGIVLGLISLHRIFIFGDYRPMYKELLVDTILDTNTAAINAQTEQSRKKISADTTITSNHKGFEYLNELFIKRHQKVLWKSVKRIALAALAFFAVSLIAIKFNPDFKGEINELLLTYLPYMVFVMYFINRGTGFTQALFINCDHSLLTYSFYKKPNNILKLFWIRLREIVKINLLPALVIGTGLALLLYATGGTDNMIIYVILFVSIIAISIFFSVHYLMLYYLLQPYNAGTEVKSGTYQIIIWVTYAICYAMLKLKVSTIIFGMATIVFCILYCLIASFLVYKLAPKTFKIRG